MKHKQRVTDSRKNIPATYVSARQVLKQHGDAVYNLALNAARMGLFDSFKVMTTPTDKRGPVFFSPDWEKHVPVEALAPVKSKPVNPEPIKVSVSDVVKAVSLPEGGTIDMKLQEKIARNQEIMIDVLLRIEAAQLRQEKIWTTSV